MAFTIQYLAVHDRNVESTAFAQNINDLFLRSFELSIISFPALFAEFCHLFNKGSLKMLIIRFLIAFGLTKRPYPTNKTHASIMI